MLVKNKINLIKIYKRYINNEFLKKTLEELIIKRNNNSHLDNNIKDSISQINELKKLPKQDPIVYEDIIKNLQESEKILNLTRDKLKIAKESSFNLNIKVIDQQKLLENNKIDTLNNNLKSVREIKHNNNNILDNDKIILDNIQEYDNNISNAKKSIFDISWLDPFINFMHNHSSLILTIGSGLIVGGMWYFNNVGYINIGSMLTRLGIKLFSNSPINTPRINTIEISNIPANISSNSDISHGFFRQLGKKVLEMLDIVIEKMKDKRQKYK